MDPEPTQDGRSPGALSTREARLLSQERKPARGWELWRPVLQSSAVVGFGAIACTFISTTVLADYGLSLFVLSPIVLGFTGEMILEWRRPYPVASSMAVACLSVFVACAGLLVAHIEGIVCVAMALPILLPLAMAGAGFGRILRGRKFRSKGRTLLSAVVLLPLAIVGESRLGVTPPTLTVSSAVVIEAPPAVIWSLLSNIQLTGAPDDPLFGAGIAYPVAVRTQGSGVGAARFCELTTGTMPERIEVWEPNRRLRFSVLSTPQSMRETNPFGEVRAPHLNGFFRCEAGEFTLERLPGGRTLVRGTSWYSNALYPVHYWRLWSDTIVHRVQQRVLAAIKAKAEVK